DDHDDRAEQSKARSTAASHGALMPRNSGLADRFAAGGRMVVVERLGARQSAACVRRVGLHEHTATSRAGEGGLADLGDLDDALTEIDVIDALADLELVARAVRPHRPR